MGFDVEKFKRLIEADTEHGEQCKITKFKSGTVRIVCEATKDTMDFMDIYNFYGGGDYALGTNRDGAWLSKERPETPEEDAMDVFELMNEYQDKKYYDPNGAFENHGRETIQISNEATFPFLKGAFIGGNFKMLIKEYSNGIGLEYENYGEWSPKSKNKPILERW